MHWKMLSIHFVQGALAFQSLRMLTFWIAL
uniref:Uncharacterized protein n=1 Tax=Anguilla anguilla TaxID=7936 RepID=A0A0E9Y2P2_ANGAN